MLLRVLALAGTAALGVGMCCTGMAQAATPSPGTGLVVSINDTGLGGIYPGASNPATYTIANRGTHHVVTLSDADPTGRVHATFSVDDAHPACDPAWFSFTPEGDELVTYAPGTSSTYTGSVQMMNAPVNQDSCKGATLTLSVTVAA
jgi:hypothetical protein